MNPAQKALLAPIRFYKKYISPGLGDHCRFIQTHGAVKGLILTVWRILRCNPLGGQGFDPVPPKGQFRLPHYWQGRKGHF
mgnify:FL=1